MEIIKFPGAAKLNKKVKQGQDLKVEPVPNSPKNKLMMGPIDFTCPHCRNKIKFTCENMIFKALDFFCSKCGTRTKVSNPALSDTTTTYQEKLTKTK